MDRGAPLFPQVRKRQRVFRGLSERQEWISTWVAIVVVMVLATGWVETIVRTRKLDADAARARGADHDTAAAPPTSP
ncbi:MAG TPA: hypothetical protein VLU46_13265 [Thermoanaerobaculia bacterium]|nr:hypothetical protein [Thermoanaerobaculia bacterium]